MARKAVDAIAARYALEVVEALLYTGGALFDAEWCIR